MANSLKEQQNEYNRLQEASKTIPSPIENASHSRSQTGWGCSQVCEKYDIRPSQFYQWEIIVSLRAGISIEE